MPRPNIPGAPVDLEERIQRNLGRAMFAARWIMAPIYVGLLVALLLIVIKFVEVLIEGIPGFLKLNGNDAVFLVLKLVDLSLIANLIVIVIFAGWENFVGRLLAVAGDGRPELLAGLDFSSIKLRPDRLDRGDRRHPDPGNLRAHRRHHRQYARPCSSPSCSASACLGCCWRSLTG